MWVLVESLLGLGTAALLAQAKEEEKSPDGSQSSANIHHSLFHPHFPSFFLSPLLRSGEPQRSGQPEGGPTGASS